nr:uncharacterized protein LOC109186057 [Ipomoea batatas]
MGEPDDNTEQPDTNTRSPEAITNPQPTSEEESESDNDQDQGKEDKVLLPFSSLIYGILCKQGFRKHPQEEELSPTSVYSIDRRLFFKSHFDDCSTFKSAVVPEGESVSSTRSRVSVDFAAVSARVLTTQSIIKSLKSTVVQMEKVLLEDQMLLQSFETDEMDLDSAR